MIFTKRFYHDNQGRYFIDLPEYIEQGGHPEDLEMVGMAADMIDYLRPTRDSTEVIVQFSDEFIEDCDFHLVFDTKTEGGGANYLDTHNMENEPTWLCDVVKWLFGKFPKDLYVKQINK